MNKTTLRLIKGAKETLEYIEGLRNPMVELSHVEREAIKIIVMAIKYTLDTAYADVDDDEDAIPTPTYILELGGEEKMCEMSVKRLQELELKEDDRKCYIDLVKSIYGGVD